jgi:hypothetical protein
MSTVSEAYNASITAITLTGLLELIDKMAADSEQQLILPKHVVEPYLNDLKILGYKIRGWKRNQVEIQWMNP